MDKKISSKAEMLREFHVIMGVTCAHCKFDETGHGPLRYCELDGKAYDENAYCHCWEEKNEEEAEE